MKAVLSVMLLSGVLAACAHAEQTTARLSADMTFRCLWWSQAQIERFDPNSPPPKSTEVTIRKWEYTDPVGIPHPDIVDVVVVLTNEGTAPLTGVVATIAGQWRIGPVKAPARAIWNRSKAIQTSQPLTVVPGSPTILRVPIDIAGLIAELETKGFWPWMLRASLTVRAAGSERSILDREIDLPIRPGD